MRFTSENQPKIRKSRKGIKNKSTVLRETYSDIFTDSDTGLSGKELIKIVVEKILIKDNISGTELELLTKIGMNSLVYEIEQKQKNILLQRNIENDDIQIIDTNELLNKFRQTITYEEKQWKKI